MIPAYVIRFTVDDRHLSALHARAFGGDPDDVRPWVHRLHRHALTWVGAFDDQVLVGFVQVAWDGGAHAFLLDTAVDPVRQHQGVGTALVTHAVTEARAAGCTWLRVDCEPHLQPFYRSAGFQPTAAGILRLT